MNVSSLAMHNRAYKIYNSPPDQGNIKLNNTLMYYLRYAHAEL